MSSVKIDKTNFMKIIDGEKLPIVIDFWASWCGPCQMLGPVYEEVSEELKTKAVLAKVNVEEEMELAQSFAVRGIPTMVVIKEKKVIGRFSGYMPKEALKAKINEIIEKQ
jgi:thioredoxin 1